VETGGATAVGDGGIGWLPVNAERDADVERRTCAGRRGGTTTGAGAGVSDGATVAGAVSSAGGGGAGGAESIGVRVMTVAAVTGAVALATVWRCQRNCTVTMLVADATIALHATTSPRTRLRTAAVLGTRSGVSGRRIGAVRGSVGNGLVLCSLRGGRPLLHVLRRSTPSHRRRSTPSQLSEGLSAGLLLGASAGGAAVRPAAVMGPMPPVTCGASGV
jgi:hypothetical protein